jgi:hypothetical protein
MFIVGLITGVVIGVILSLGGIAVLAWSATRGEH